MRADCVKAITQAIGRAMTRTEVQDIEARLVRHMRQLARKDPEWIGKSTGDRLNEAAQSAAEELIGESELKQQRAALSVLAHDRINQHIVAQKAKGMAPLEALDRVIAFHADNKGNTQSVETQSRAIERDALRQMIGTLEGSNPKWFGLFENDEGIRSLMQEIFGESSGSAEAAKGAKEWGTVTAALRDRFNRAGGDVGQLEDWGLPHHHSQTRVAKAGREQWVADTLPLLNREHYFNADGTRMSDPQLADFLKEAWTTIATGGANKLSPGEAKGSGARANRGSESRQVHFKSADSYLAYQQKYGERSLYEALTGHIANVSKDIALVETFGPNPDHAFRFWRDQSVQEGKLANPVESGKFDEQAIRTENLYNVVSGKTQPVASEWLANSFDTVRNWLVGARLGSAVITSFSDDATLHLTAHLNNLPEMRLIANELAAFNPANRMEERMALRTGLAMNTLISSLNRFGQKELGASFSKKLASTVLRVSGLNAMTEARKRAFGVTMMSSLGSVAREHANLAALDPVDHRILLSKGISETDFAVWKAAQLENWGGGNDHMLTPESIYRIPDAQIDSIIAPKVQELKANAKVQIDELASRNTQDSQWAQKRTDSLRQWVDDAKGRLATRHENADAVTREKLTALSSRLSGLYDRVDAVNSYFDQAKERQISMSDLRKAAAGEGRDRVAEGRIAASVRSALAETHELSEQLGRDFTERFAEKEAQIKTLIESGDEKKIAAAIDRFDALYYEARAKMDARIDKAGERLTEKTAAATEKLTAIRDRLQQADQLWKDANAARPTFSQMRAQGVREGRAEQAAVALQKQMRDVTRELASSKTEWGLDLAERWASKKAELDEFVARAQERAQRRQFVIDRIQRQIDPSIESARREAREQAATKLLGAVLEETDVAVIEPGAKERAFTGAGIQRGTWKGELVRSFFLFKSFPLAMIARHWNRGMSLPNAGGKAAYLATLMAATTVAGMVSVQIGEMLNGRDPRNMNPFKKGGVRNWFAAMLKGGSLGIYGDFLFSEASQHGGSPLATVTGPVLGSAEELFNLTQGNIMQAAQGKAPHAGAEAIKFVKGNLPGASLWYAKAALDHLVFQRLQEYASPGYLAKMRARAQKEFNQKYWWEPGEVAPDRAPDLGAAVGE